MRKGNGKGGGRSSGTSGKVRNGVRARGSFFAAAPLGEAKSRSDSWSDQVAHLIQHEGLSREKARDQVIMGELRSGHADALAALLIEGHVPSPSVRFALALMLLENDAAVEAIARHQVDTASLWLPHRLVTKPRPPQPRLAPTQRGAVKTAGEAGSASAPAPVMHDLGYEAAIARLDQAVLATVPGASPAARTMPKPPGQPKRRR
jgi:hypothetical protein